jgi:DNA-directed RNA polymerase specialized sigma24 family protein
MDDQRQVAPDSIPRPGAEPTTWSELLTAYRREPKGYWAGLLISRLGPWLGAARRQLHAAPPYLDEDDVAQQLLLEVLRIGRRWHPSCEDNWIPRRLVERAGRRVLKKLLREQLHQSFELDAELPGALDAEPDLVLETPIGKASVSDLQVIFRARVLGEPIEQLAARYGLSPAQMQHRVKSALKRARAQETAH